ncbi:MAG: GntR family transcriptional regulator [Victivallaceae bacterium]|nr:GntR family transcriptional regulator [Victivallaceae bacterium]
MKKSDNNSCAPLFEQMKECIIKLIIDSGVKPGEKIPSENVLCRSSEVSIRTVRRALTELEKDGIITRRQGLGSFLNKLEVQQHELPFGTIGILFSEIGQIVKPTFSRILASMEAHIQELGYRYRLYPIGKRHIEQETVPLEQIISADDVCGLIAISSLTELDIKFLNRTKLPLVALTKYRKSSTNSIIFDFFTAAQTGVEHLWQNGFKRIAVVCGRLTSADSAVKLGNDFFIDGIRDIYAKSGIKFDDKMIFQTNYSAEDSCRIADEIVNLPQRPDAIFTVDDLIAQGASFALEEAGLVLGRDIGLLSCNDSLELKNISSMRMPLGQLGVSSVDMLIKNINGDRQVKRQKMLSAELSVRSSTVPDGNMFSSPQTLTKSKETIIQ